MLKKLKDNLGLIFILILAFTLRLPFLNTSVWLDEAAQILESERPLTQQLEIIPDFQPPLLHLLTHIALQINDHIVWLRLIGALIPGLITIWVTIKIGEHLYSKPVGLLAGMLLAISSFHIFYSQELRPYSLPAMFAVLSWLELILIRSKSGKKEIKSNLLRFTVYSILGLYSSYLYPFLFLSQCIFCMFYLKRLYPFLLVCLAATITAYLPWLPTFFKQLSAGGLLRQELPGWDQVVSISQIKSIPLTLGKFVFGVLEIDASLFFIISTATLSVLLLLQFVYRYRVNLISYCKEHTLLLIWLIVTILSSWCISFFIPVIQPKRLLFLLPAFVLLLSSLFTKTYNLPKFLPKFIAGLFITIYCFVSSYSLLNYWTQPKLQRENWQALHAEITSNFNPQEAVMIFSFPAPFSPWVYYDRDTYPTFSTGTLSITTAPDLTQRLKGLEKFKYLIVFDYLRDLTDPNDQLITEITSFGYKEVQVLDYPNIGFVRVYAKPETVISFKTEITKF